LKLKSIKINYIFNTILTISNFIFPLITFPYVARILGPEGIGKVNFSFTVASYFIMIAQVGIPVYGIKEISKVRENKQNLSKVFSELFTINTIMTVIIVIVYSIIFLFNTRMQAENALFFVAGISVFLSLFSIDWLYSGLEEYKFIAMRSIFVKIISVIMLFILVHNKNDYIVYAIITVLVTVLTNALNIFAARKKIKFRIKNLDLKRHRKPIISLSLAGFIGSIYANLDIILLGSLTGDKYVGYYSTTRKITGLMVAVIGSLGTVLIPRLSYYLDKNMKDEYNQLAQKSLNFIYFLSFPAIIYIIFMAKDILQFFGGEAFTSASMSLGIISFQILATSLASFYGFQVLLPHNDEKSMVKANIAGALVNVVLNLLLIKTFYHNATSISIVLSEITVAFVQIRLSKPYTDFKMLNKESIKYIKGSLLLIIFLIIIKIFIKENYLINLVITSVLCGTIYFGYLLRNKEEFSTLLLKKLIRRRIKDA
jgi:O-antigen/teichoic acid export membrane protein